MSARSVLRVECASDAYKMDLSANIDQNGTAFSGNWFASQYRQGRKVSGQDVEGLIEAKSRAIRSSSC